MIAPIPRTYAGSIIELGAGSGALTLRLCSRCPQARILAFEINPTLARDNRNNLTKAGINGQVELITAPAENLLSEMDRRGLAKADYVVSGIPLGNLDKERAGALIDTINSALGESGMYIQFQHSMVDRKKIKKRFPSTRTVPVVLNFPPAVVYYATKSGAPSGGSALAVDARA
jgi:phospholipid N-methyltransferase